MNAPRQDEADRFVVLVADDEPEVLDSLLRDLRDLWGTALETEGYPSAEALLERVDELEREQIRIALVVADHVLPGMNGADLLIRLHERPATARARKVMLSGQSTTEDLSRALNRGALHANIAKPWTPDSLIGALRPQLTEFFTEQAPGHIPRLSHFLGVDELSTALVQSELKRKAMDRQLRSVRRSFLAARELSDEEVDLAMVEDLYEGLESPERLEVEADTVLFRQGEAMEHVYIRLDGEVQLTRTAAGREMIFHTQSVGRVIGLLALAYNGRAAFTCKTVTPATFIRLSVDELDQALQTAPDLSVHFIADLVRSLARRNRRAVDLRIEIDELNQALARERDQLQETLRQLKKTQTRLVESEKMATLGQLIAGIGHELNNPVAAIGRAAEFASRDVKEVAREHPDAAAFMDMMDAAMWRHPLSTRDQREQARKLGAILGDRALGQRLARIRITDQKGVDRYFGGAPETEREVRLRTLERYFELGTALRNIHSCAERIGSLVTGLRSYARANQELAPDVDILQGLDETLLLFGRELRDIELEKDYQALPPVRCRPGQINQIWTNIISNAVKAMDGRGRLEIATRSCGEDQVEVRFTDSGPGISPENIEKIFDVNFTTRQGRVDFGLGLGLPICREIVARHGGAIEVSSEPGRTRFAVRLPVRSAEVGAADEPRDR